LRARKQNDILEEFVLGIVWYFSAHRHISMHQGSTHLPIHSGLYITGTDTGIGKTQVSCAILRALHRQGMRVQGMKPVASGCQWHDAMWKNDDALDLMAACASQAAYAHVNPYALPAATAPQIAAQQAGLELAIAPIQTAYQQLCTEADTVLVEGVGGWLAPLSASLDQADVVHALNIPVLMVVGMRLGCLNHARLTEHAIQQSGVHLLGWISNYSEQGFDQDGAYLNALTTSLGTPHLANMSFNAPLQCLHVAGAMMFNGGDYSPR
jgi:dethiobiotin synthetase